MFKSSITSLLVAAFALLVAGLTVVVLIFSVGAWTRYREAGRVIALVDLDRTLFNAIVQQRGQVSGIQTALISSDDAKSGIDAALQRSRIDQAALRAALLASRVDGADGLVAGIERAVATLAGQQHLVDEMAARSKPDRSLASLESWRGSVYGVVDALSAASTAISNAVRMETPSLAELVDVRRAIWSARDKYGLQCSTLRANVQSGAPLSPETLGKEREVAGAYQLTLRDLTTFLSRPGVPAAVMASFAEAQAAVAAGQAFIDGVVAGLDGGHGPVVPASEWTRKCDEPLTKLVAVGYTSLDQAQTVAADQRRAAGIVLIAAAMGLALSLAVGVVALMALRVRFMRPTRLLLAGIERLSHQDYDEPVPQPAYPDELGNIALALESMRRNALDAQRLRRDGERTQAAELDRARQLEALCTAFQSAAGSGLTRMETAAISVQGTVDRMGHLVEETDQGAKAVAAAAAEASVNVNTVAAATEQLSASITEIGLRAGDGAAQARFASQQAQAGTHIVATMNDSAERIGAVLTLINDIASQTNLLALNATIEAARAGDAGKGFAVVAGEVKSLANQTARATEEVARQIAEMRANTQQAVGAIDEVAQTIGRIDEMTAAIAAAVEQQGAATRDISANVQQAAAGTGEVTQAIAGVATSSSVTGEAARALAQAVQGMDAERRKLGQAIATFMDGVRGAAAAPSRSPVRNGPACDKPAS